MMIIVSCEVGSSPFVDATPEAPHVRVKNNTIPVICRLHVVNGSLAQLVEMEVAGSSPAGTTKF